MSWELDPFGNLLITVPEAERLGRRVRAAWAAAQFRAVMGTLSPYFFQRSRATEALRIADQVAAGGPGDYAVQTLIDQEFLEHGLFEELTDEEGYNYSMIMAVYDLSCAADGLLVWEQIEPQIRKDNSPEVYAADSTVNLVSHLAVAFATICVWRQGVQVYFGANGIEPEYFDPLQAVFLKYSRETYEVALRAEESEAGPGIFAGHELDWSVPPLPPEQRIHLVRLPPPHEVEHMRSLGIGSW